eukprot:TRINITY_DN6833_c0_g2_i3.p3 TRINITY_DN6833_c0_g2~~TRINITY_DN6833_c0_g2_i3.p3  ORF type:complete len:112 (-),score=36.27 TRINITY_DN6833_c0_g2_i3:547-843(-)
MSEDAVVAKVKVVDMQPDTKEDILALVRKTVAEQTEERKIAEILKTTCDEKYGSAWHCVVGKSYGVWVTHETGSFIYVEINGLNVVLWKNGKASVISS